MIKPPEPPEHISKELMDNLKPLPKCVHGHINSLCIICNKEFYFPGIFKAKGE